jgi:thymidylate kinase
LSREHFSNGAVPWVSNAYPRCGETPETLASQDRTDDLEPKPAAGNTWLGIRKNLRLDVIIEFIGTPGVGKTTLLPTVVETLQERGVAALTVVDAARPFTARTLLGQAVCRLTPGPTREAILWRAFLFLSFLYRLRFTARNPWLVVSVLGSQFRRPTEAGSRERKVLHWFFRAVGDYEFLKSRARSNEALLFDEGFIHRVVQFYGSAAEEPNPKRISRYVNLLPKPDYVIFVNAPAEICERRIYERGIWERLQNKSKQEVTTFVANCGTCVKFAVEQICRNGWSVIAVDNSGDAPAPATRALRRALSLVPLNGQGH